MSLCAARSAGSASAGLPESQAAASARVAESANRRVVVSSRDALRRSFAFVRRTLLESEPRTSRASVTSLPPLSGVLPSARRPPLRPPRAGTVGTPPSAGSPCGTSRAPLSRSSPRRIGRTCAAHPPPPFAAGVDGRAAAGVCAAGACGAGGAPASPAPASPEAFRRRRLSPRFTKRGPAPDRACLGREAARRTLGRRRRRPAASRACGRASGCEGPERETRRDRARCQRDVLFRVHACAGAGRAPRCQVVDFVCRAKAVPRSIATISPPNVVAFPAHNDPRRHETMSIVASCAAAAATAAASARPPRARRPNAASSSASVASRADRTATPSGRRVRSRALWRDEDAASDATSSAGRVSGIAETTRTSRRTRAA